MKEKEQSSIEWLIEELKKEKILKDLPTTLSLMFDKAKEIHKKEIIYGFNQGYREGIHDGISCVENTTDISEYSNAIEYYNEK